MVTEDSHANLRLGLGNIVRNFAWLLGGKGFGAVCSILYLAILSRSLGLKDFGHFSLIFGTGQALVAIAGFQTWQTIVRFGADAAHEKNWGRFGRLAWLCASIDVGGAIVGTLIAAIVYYGFGEVLDLNPEFIDMAFAFNCALLWSRLTTPNGIVRVLNRFDVATYVEAVVPAGRLTAAAIIIAVGPSVALFLLAWAFFDILAGVLYWIAAWRLAPEAISARNFGQWRQTREENPGLGQFFGITYASSTLDSIYKQGPLLAVGALLGTSAAGLYRLADQLAQGGGKLSVLVARVIFPEFARARSAMSGEHFGILVRRVSKIAAITGVAVTLAALLFGKELLGLIGGDDFSRGAVVLVPLAIGASLELASVSFEPMLYSTSNARRALLSRVIAVLTLGVGILLFYPSGPVGVGWAVALGMTALYIAMALSVRSTLRSVLREESSV